MTASSRQLALDLGVPEPSLYHSEENSYGYFATLVRDREWHERLVQYALDQGKAEEEVRKLPKLRQQMHHVRDFGKVIPLLPKDRDSFISQADFRVPTDAAGKALRPNRRAVNVLRLPVAFVDLDVRIEPHELALVDYFVKQALSELQDAGMPKPSVILFSGRGLHIKWLFTSSLPGEAAPRWNAVQLHLAEWFKEREWPVDTGARDISRVLRIERTVNEKSGETCEVVWADFDGFGDVETIEFDTLADAVLPFSRDVYRAKVQAEYKARGEAWARNKKQRQFHVIEGGKKSVIGSQRGLNVRQLNWDRLHDLRTLSQLRGHIPDNDTAHREIMVFEACLAGVWSGIITHQNLYSEARTLASQMFPGAWSARHKDKWSSHLAELHRRAEKYAQGETERLYTPRNDTLINRLEITDDEQRQLKTIISKDIKHERRRRKNIESGVTKQTREDFEANSLSRQKPWEKEGISRATWYRRQRVRQV